MSKIDVDDIVTTIIGGMDVIFSIIGAIGVVVLFPILVPLFAILWLIGWVKEKVS